jgi:cell division transport system permease protein
MNTRTANYCLKQGFVNIKRNKLFSLASIGTIAACTFLIGVIFTIIINVNFMEKKVEQQVGVTIFFNEGLSQQGIDDIGKTIKSDSRVKSYEYTSAEQAWESFKKNYFKDNSDLAEGFSKENPLANSASYTVYLNSINDQKAFATAMEKVQGVRQVKYSNPTREFLTNFGKMLGYASIALIIILLGVGIFLISNTVMIGISVRRHEIKIMKLIGATNSFVRAPFIIEGVTIGLLGSIIPLVIIRLVYDKLIDLIMTKFGVLGNSIPFASVHQIFLVLVPLGLGIGAGIGLIGSIVSMRKHLKV